MTDPTTSPDAPRRGLLIACEGLDGSGKSTMARRLAGWLRERGRKVLLSCEPTDGPWGRKLRSTWDAQRRPEPAEELEWMRLDREQHLAERILPALERGEVVILDRYYYSSEAYQGVRAGLDPAEVHALMTSFCPVPDRTLLFEVDLDTAVSRINDLRDHIPDPLERAENLERVQAVFAAMDYPEIVRIDAGRPEDEVFADVVAAVEPLLEEGPAE